MSTLSTYFPVTTVINVEKCYDRDHKDQLKLTIQKSHNAESVIVGYFREIDDKLTLVLDATQKELVVKREVPAETVLQDVALVEEPF